MIDAASAGGPWHEAPRGDATSSGGDLGRLQEDQRLRWERGERILVEDFLVALPRPPEDPDGILDLIYHEILVREELGEEPGLEEYLRRFPQFDGALRDQFRVHEALKAVGPPGADSDAEPSTLVMEDPAAVGPRPSIPGFEVIRELGRGGMGVVYLARQAGLNRLVALKMILAGEYSRPRDRARFRGEAEAVARLAHPNLVQIHETGEHQGRPYFSMEHVDGGRLADALRGTPWPPRRAARLVETLARATHSAHERGVIHRDLTPSNVLLTAAGEPKIVDFGLAKLVGDGAGRTASGDILGTPGYMAPEQATGRSRAVGPAADVYALGAILYELLTGRPPFVGATVLDALAQVLRDDPIAPCRLQPKVPRDLETVCLKCLEKDPGRRYPTAAALAEDLRRYLADEPVSAGRPSIRYRARKFVRRNKWAVLAAASLLLALVAGIIGTTWGLVRANDARSVAEAEAGRRQAALAEARGQLFEALRSRARAGRYSHRMGRRLDALEALTQAARIHPDERLRDEAIAAMALTDLRPVPGWPSAPALAFGRRCELYARAESPGVISIRRLPEDREVRRIDAGPLPDHIAFSPDDRFLTGFSRGSALRIWRVADGQPALRDPPRAYAGHAFSPDGARLWLGHQQSIVELDLATGREVMRWPLPEPAWMLALHPDGRRLAVGYASGNVASVYDADRGALIANLPVGEMSGQVVAWCPDGERLAIAGSDPRIQIWHVAAGRRVTALEGHTALVTALTFHPDEDLLASHGWDGVVILWHLPTGQPVMRWPSVSDPRFSDDGRWLGVAHPGERADLFEVISGREYRTLIGSGGRAVRYRDGSISPDGRMLAVERDRGAELWDLHRGRKLAELPAGARVAVFEGPRGEPGDRGPSGPSPRALLTGGSLGLLRWPITRSANGERRRLHLGAPQCLLALDLTRLAPGPDGRTLAVTSADGGPNRILDAETGIIRRELPHPGGEVQAISGDGRWAASCGWGSDLVRLWDVSRRRIVREWAPGKRNLAFFTPDSRTLIVSRGEELSFWDVGTLRLIRRWRRDVEQLPGWVAFALDARLLAVEMAPAVIHLKEVATGRTVAQLEDPHGERATWLGFTPDGARLVAVAGLAGSIHIWDLRAIRARLKAMGLDWDWPEFPPAAGGDAAGPATIEVSLVDLPALAPNLEVSARRAIEAARRELAAHPDSAVACHELAWAYLRAPAALRDVAAAVPLAERAVRLGEDVNSRNTLGLAYYRAGRYCEAIEVLRVNIEHQDGTILAVDLYVLAMSYHRLGETARALDYYHLATRWDGETVRWARGQRDIDQTFLDELAAFRDEAEELLGIDRKERGPRAAR